MGITFVIFMAIFIRCCAIHTPSPNPNLPKNLQFSETLRRPVRSLQKQHYRQANSGSRGIAPPPYPGRGGEIPQKMIEVPAYQVGYRDMVTEKVGVIITDRVVMNHQQIVKTRPVQLEVAVTVGDLDAITKKIWTDNTYLLVMDLVD